MRTPRTVIITGASSGLGFALAQAFLERGDNVVGNARSQARLDAAAAQLGNPAGFVGVAGDIAEKATAERLFATALKTFGRVDILVNNAGIFIPKPVVDYSEADVDALVGTNLKGFFYPAQAAAQVMQQQGHGHIIAITASIALQPDTRVPALLPVLVKGGLNQAVKGLALELAGSGVQVNAVAPGIIDTPLHGGQAEGLGALSPSGRTGQPQDVVDAVLYLTDARFVSGVILPVDGGSTAGTWH
ncbi:MULTISPECIES: SDR family NAD(P)-dependent oxidoreductase [Pseudomonas]|uniref:SDR family oxidoreductase n=1 Tax=Pseudomonas entomophila TaxID=312306 RepID=A0A3Q8TVF3_9PSED|nr:MULTISPECIES: SDR family oxidoreductase [Pseudomonas]AZL69112.1 SDR family oxidoreductase [Pseudomonas oryziphila]MDZ4021488.1 putative oxidoreductase [Pseudomonas sichuanensis]UVL87333.1 SDR family oxidoreductase [Pseudomonas sichuanensis]